MKTSPKMIENARTLTHKFIHREIDRQGQVIR